MRHFLSDPGGHLPAVGLASVSAKPMDKEGSLYMQGSCNGVDLFPEKSETAL